jgi:thioredoxin reductase (NADPH)
MARCTPASAALSGRIEVTKTIDGIERVIGVRAAGQIFGEVPITFGTPFQGSYRATEPTRLLHIAARDFHVLAAAHPALLTQVAALASERIGGLRGIATAPPKARAVMLGHRWDNTVRELRSFLTLNQIPTTGSRPTRPIGPNAGPARRWPTTRCRRWCATTARCSSAPRRAMSPRSSACRHTHAARLTTP